MRQLDTVIEKMIEHIPKDQEDLLSDLKDQIDSFRYSAPELIALRWTRTAYVLEEYIDPTDGWQKKVADIWMDRE